MLNKKQIVVSRVVLFIWVLLLSPQININAQAVDAKFYYAPFYESETGTYIETYIALNSKSLHYKLTPDNFLEASVEVTMLFKNVDKIIEFRRFNIVSPQYPDTTSLFPNFIDLQRIVIPEGVYNFDLIIRDNNAYDSIDNYYQSQLVTVNIPSNEMSLSGIELIKTHVQVSYDNIYVKKRFEYIPYISNIYPANINKLKFYAELYFAAKDIGPLEEFMIISHIEYSNTDKPIKEFSSFESQKAYNTNTIYDEINIGSLPTGNYYLVVEVKDVNGNILLSTKKFFRREKQTIQLKNIDLSDIEITNTFVTQMVNRDSLMFYINALKPICDSSEISFIDNRLQLVNDKVMQQFFLYFWESRSKREPHKAWLKYKFKLNIVESEYKTEYKKGYNTSRGRVYMQYGSPNSITNKKDKTVLNKCEIWYYYKIADQTNKKFVFVSDGLGNYKLVHSDMVGEIHNDNWENELKGVGE